MRLLSLPIVPPQANMLRLVAMLSGLASLLGVRQNVFSPVNAASARLALTASRLVQRRRGLVFYEWQWQCQPNRWCNL